MEKSTGQVQPLDVEVPVDIEYLWQFFWELNASRGNLGFGPSPISYLEMEAWSRLTNNSLERWEISILKQMDEAYLETISEMQKRYDSQAKPKPKRLGG